MPSLLRPFHTKASKPTRVEFSTRVGKRAQSFSCVVQITNATGIGQRSKHNAAISSKAKAASAGVKTALAALLGQSVWCRPCHCHRRPLHSLLDGTGSSRDKHLFVPFKPPPLPPVSRGSEAVPLGRVKASLSPPSLASVTIFAGTS